MPRVALDLNKREDRRQVNGEWRVAGGLVSGAPNEGLTAQLLEIPPRRPDFDDPGCSRLWFETNIDNHGEVWVDGKIDRSAGVIVGLNAQHRVEVSGSAMVGARHVIACLVANAPLAEPRGGIFMRYVTLACESPG